MGQVSMSTAEKQQVLTNRVFTLLGFLVTWTIGIGGAFFFGGGLQESINGISTRFDRADQIQTQFQVDTRAQLAANTSDLRRVDMLDLRTTSNERAVQDLVGTVRDMQMQLNNQGGDIRVIREILERRDRQEERRPERSGSVLDQ
jgi:uncharacterized protein (UPF0335 family)